MDEATKSADSIRLDIRELKSRYDITRQEVMQIANINVDSRFAVINAVEKCYICNYPLLTRQFYIFPCQHAFHADCLINRVCDAKQREPRPSPD